MLIQFWFLILVCTCCFSHLLNNTMSHETVWCIKHTLTTDALLQHFLTHSEGEDGQGPGTPRAQPYDDDLLEMGSPLAVIYLEWIGKNMPGFDFPRKAKTLVSCSHHYIWVLHCSTVWSQNVKVHG